MNDQNRELPSPVELPVPIAGADAGLPDRDAQLNMDQGTREKLSQAPSVANGSQGVIPAATAQGVQASQDDHTAQVQQLAGASPQIADDTDLIEKEWVEKAKEIVEKTRDNPYLQNKAINEIKTDYIKKRYNKDISTSGSSS